MLMQACVTDNSCDLISLFVQKHLDSYILEFVSRAEQMSLNSILSSQLLQPDDNFTASDANTLGVRESEEEKNALIGSLEICMADKLTSYSPIRSKFVFVSFLLKTSNKGASVLTTNRCVH